MAATDGMATSRRAQSLIADEENSYLKNKKDKYKHNQYLLEALLHNSSDDIFCEFVQILESIAEGMRYSHITRELRAAYQTERGRKMR